MKRLLHLREAAKPKKEVHFVISFGRLSPPTIGHEKLVKTVHEIAEKYHAGHEVVLSHSHDTDKNPLSPAKKLKHAKRFFPGTNLGTSNKEYPTLMKQCEILYRDKGVTNLHIVCGSDRMEVFKKVIMQYNGTKPNSLYNFKEIMFHSSGERDPEAEGVEGMSASKMRGHAKEGNFEGFKQGIPKHVSEKHASELFHDVRKGMGIKEDLEYFVESLETHGLGIPHQSDIAIGRSLMPQIQSADVKEFLEFMKSQGIKSKRVKVHMKHLKPSQSEFSGKKVTVLMRRVKAGEQPFANKTILISNDGYILDGHHRWLTKYNLDTSSDDNVIELDAPIMDLIHIAKRFPKTFYKSVNEDLLDEGIHDPGIFKAVFLAGGPGSGKDFILGRIISGFGLVEVSSDPFLEHLMRKGGLDLKMPQSQWAERDIVRGRAKNLEQEKKRLVIAGRLGIIVNGTADEVQKIQKKKAELEGLGYDCMMVYVSVADDISRQRNIERGDRGGRAVPEPIRKEKWDAAHASKTHYPALFGPGKFIVVDNSADLRKLSTDERKKVDESHLSMYKQIRKFISAPIANPVAKAWIHDQAAHVADRFRQTNPDPAKLDEEFDMFVEAVMDSEHHTVDNRTSHGGTPLHITKTADTATASHEYNNSPKMVKLKPLGVIRQEAADAMSYDFDTTMASLAPAGTPAAKGYLNPRLEDAPEPKKKPFGKIIKEMREYIVEKNTLENSDDLM